MAFPNNIDVFLDAKDPTSTDDISNIKEYQRLLSVDIASANEYLGNMPNGIEMNLNAGRYNQVIGAVSSIEKFYKNDVKPYIESTINAYSDIGLWSDNADYSIGNIVCNGSEWFKCVTKNGKSSIVIQPEVSPNWQLSWVYFLKHQEAKKYPIQSAQPQNQKIGELWFKVL